MALPELENRVREHLTGLLLPAAEHEYVAVDLDLEEQLGVDFAARDQPEY